MAITLEAAMKLTLEQVLNIVKGEDKQASAEMQALMTRRVPVKDERTGRADSSGRTHAPLAERLSQLMLERNQAISVREAEVDREASRINPPTTEELAAEAAAIAAEAAPAQANDVVPVQANDVVPAQVEPVAPVVPAVAVDYSVEDASWKAAGITVTRDAKGEIIRAVADYQITEENGEAIGRSTHFEARNLLELYLKSQNAHVLSTRAFHRVKKQNLTFKQEPKSVLTDVQIAEAAKTALAEGDPKKMASAIRSAIEAQYSAREAEMDKNANSLIMASINVEFLRRHLYDFKVCEANDKALKAYLTENRLNYTLDNLEHAFVDLSEDGTLVKPEVQVSKRSAEPVNNPPATATGTVPPAQPAAPVVANPTTESAAPVQAPVTASAVPAPTPAQTSTPVVEATAPTPAAAPNVPQPARRPGVNGGLQPGSLRAERPVMADPAQARKEFMQKVKEMSGEKMRRKLSTDPEFVKKCRAYGIQV